MAIKKIIWRASKPTPKQNPTHCEDLECHFALSGTEGCPVNERIKREVASRTLAMMIEAAAELTQLQLL